MKKIKRTVTRHQGWGYSESGYYYITIGTKDRKNFLGEINNKGNMILNHEGNIVKNEILKTGIIRNNVIIDEYIVMPNHLHVIIIIKKDIHSTMRDRVSDRLQSVPTGICIGSMVDYGKNRDKPMNNFGPQKNNLSSIVRGLKGTITKQINEYYINNNINKIFNWQPRFYDRIIRNKDELNQIRQYIKDNPVNWKNDKNY